MLKTLSFSKKILFSVLLTLFVSSTISIFMVSSNSYNASQKSTKMYIEALAESYSLKTQEDLEKAVVLTKALASSVKEQYQSRRYSKTQIINSAKDLLKNAPYAIGIAVDLDSGSMFANDDYFANQNGHDKDGRFAPYIYHNGDNINIEGLTSQNEPREWVDTPRVTQKEHLTEPYYYKANGKDTLMVTISAPIITNEGKFLGATTVDISLEGILNEISKIKVYDNGYGFLLSNQGTFIGHPKKELITKKITQVKGYTNSTQIIDSIKESKTYSYTMVSPLNKEESFHYIKPFSVANTDINWGFAFNIPKEEYLATASRLQMYSIIAGIVSFVIIALVIIYYTNSLSKNLQIITDGLTSFFKYLNKDISHTQVINLNTEDEFGKMAKMINTNMINTENLVEQDKELIEDVKKIVEEVKSGNLDQYINKSTKNQSLEELKTIFNEMIHVIATNISTDLNIIKKALKEYQNLNFTYFMENPKGNTAEGLNSLAKIINDILAKNKSNGITLQDSANTLLTNVNTLNTSTNDAASSIEETATALEQITSNISNNTNNVVMMSQNANKLKKSSKEGENLANQTTIAMDDINTQVTSINEAIAVIDQIAFQTNILSLNAAVEAATAGEAGKGFAVVAGEVRNLASRSAEAAKEIKYLVENATQKANNGKEIADKMIQGYIELNDNVTKTLDLISNIENASKEQQKGIIQINDAVNILDKQTQQNASIAKETREIANNTQLIANEIVKDANEKNFIGK